eukprot:4963283-Pyramimonas_sp.AAC.1
MDVPMLQRVASAGPARDRGRDADHPSLDAKRLARFHARAHLVGGRWWQRCRETHQHCHRRSSTPGSPSPYDLSVYAGARPTRGPPAYPR